MKFTLDDLMQFVEDCHLEYAALGLEPGNPVDGEWNRAHHPSPKCAGGKMEVWLLKKHHATHGVMQSDCYDRCCLFAWEFEYLEGEMLEKAREWKAENGRRNMSKQTFEQRSEYSKKREANKTQKEKEQIGKKISKTTRTRYTPEERSERAREAVMSMTPEQRREAGVKGGKANKGVPKNFSDGERRKRAEAARQRNKVMNSRVYEDPEHPELGRHNAGNLVKAQKKAGLPHGKEYRREVTP